MSLLRKLALLQTQAEAAQDDDRRAEIAAEIDRIHGNLRAHIPAVTKVLIDAYAVLDARLGEPEHRALFVSILDLEGCCA